MKFTLLSLVFAMTLTAFASGAEKNAFEISRGVNLSHWLSQRADRPREQIKTYVTEFDIIMLKDAGFDHVRIPIDEEVFWDEAGNPLEDAWIHLEKGLNWARAHDLRVIVDLHIIRSHYFNAAHAGDENRLFEDPAEQQKFVDLWHQISERIGHHSVDWVAYEFMNEAVGDDPEDWNRLIRQVYTAAREKETRRTFVIGSFQWQSISMLERLWVPEDDPNIIISFHTYAPFTVTHYRAEWTALEDYQGPIHYPGLPYPEDTDFSALPQELGDMMRENQKPFDLYAAMAELKPAVEFARAKGLTVYCGEWGCIIYVPREARLAYYRDWVNAFEALDIPWTIWDYKGHFRIVNDDTQEIDHELIDILTGR
jgi:endoglucanase